MPPRRSSRLAEHPPAEHPPAERPAERPPAKKQRTAPQPRALAVGDALPHLTLVDQHGNDVHTADLTDAVIFTYPRVRAH